MKPNKYIIFFARKFWFWTWKKLMNGFAPSDQDGNYQRPDGLFFDKSFKGNYKKNSKLYLLVGKSCPWCHRVLLLHKLKNLSNEIIIIFLKPDIEKGRWIFQDNLHGCKSLEDIYKKSNNNINISLRETLPVLISSRKETFSILSNESAGILSFLNSKINKGSLETSLINDSDSYEMDLINRRINNGVYKCGFSRNQKAYIKASNELFNALDIIENRLKTSEGPWLYGKRISMADIYLFPTLIRWELIYSKLFKCTKKEISEYENIMHWRFNFFNLKGIDKTCFATVWAEDYYKALFPLNPNQIVPIQDSLENILKKSKKK